MEDSELGKIEIDKQSVENKRKIQDLQARLRYLEGENQRIKESYDQIYNEHIKCKYKTEQLERNLRNSEENCKILEKEIQAGSMIAKKLEIDLNNALASQRSLQDSYETQSKELERKLIQIKALEFEKEKVENELKLGRNELSECIGIIH